MTLNCSTVGNGAHVNIEIVCLIGSNSNRLCHFTITNTRVLNSVTAGSNFFEHICSIPFIIGEI